jgi:outer membrane lipoprotein-sorting protein
MALAVNGLFAPAVLAAAPVVDDPGLVRLPRASEIIALMEGAYAQVEGYQTQTEIRIYRDNKVTETQRFRYAFTRPDRIRLEFETPHPGLVLTYPDKNGKVTVKPGGWFGFVKLHLAPDNSLFKSASGQRIDQTDLGQLIRNIAHSLTDRRRGEIGIDERDGQAVIEVLADDHFLPGVQTLYRFTIDERRWLPVAVSESTPGGALKRDVTFGDLRTASPADGRPAH